MAYASIKYTGASGTTFALTNSNGDPIEYLQQNDISVYVNNVLKTVGTDYTFNGAGTAIVLNTAVSGAEVYITRTTDISDAVVDFTPGSTLTSNDLNNSNDQYRFALQEFRDTYAALTQGTDDLGEFPGIIDSTEGWISDDSHWPTTAALDNRFVDQINNESINGIKTFTSSPVVPTPTTGTQAVNKAYVDDNYWNVDGETINTSEQNAGSPAWDDTKITTAGAAAKRHDTVVQTTAPSGTDWQIGKFWLQNDANKTLSYWTGSNWSGIASGGTFTLQPTVIYVDSVNGNDTNDGHRIINPKKTIKNAVQSAAAGDIIKVAPGVYQEVLPIDITVDNLSIVGDSQRSCFVHPTVATQEQIMFRCNSGTYIDGFTFAGLKASGARGGNAIDNNATYGLPASQGWVAGFYPGCTIKKSPYINNCTNFADANIDNSAFNPNNYAGTGGDLTSAPTGGGIIVDGSLPAVNSPLRSFVVNEFTQVCLDGPGLLVCNNGYAQAVSFFGLFCHYHAKALSGGQINMEVGTTDFGRYGLIADGKSSSAIFTATANGNASAGATTFAINAPTAAGTWFGDATRPATNMLVQIGADIYPILSATANGGGWNVVVSRPDPTNRAVNLGLINGHSGGATVSFFLRSMISTASHTMEYAGSGTNYNALPENGGVPVEANEVVNLNNGKVWLTSTDQSGKFKVGDTFQVDQQTGFVTIDPNSYSPNIVQDLTPELGGNLDVLTRNIYSSVGNVQINDTLDVTGPILSSSGTAAAPGITFNGDIDTGLYRSGANTLDVTTGGTAKVRFDSTTAPLKEIYSSVYYPVVTSVDIGSAADQVSLNYMLGDMAFQNAAAINVDQAVINTATVSSAAVSSAAVTAFSNIPLLTGGGLKFPPTQVPSGDVNTLDDYEEGTFTPTVVGASTAGTATYVNRSGRYTKIGNRVYCQIWIEYNSHTGTGGTRIDGLPFTSNSTLYSWNAVTVYLDNIALTASHVAQAYVERNATYIVLQSYPTGGGAVVNVSIDPAGNILLTGHYEV